MLIRGICKYCEYWVEPGNPEVIGLFMLMHVADRHFHKFYEELGKEKVEELTLSRKEPAPPYVPRNVYRVVTEEFDPWEEIEKSLELL